MTGQVQVRQIQRTTTMREIHATVTLENIEDPSRQTTVEGFVDTDAVNLVFPRRSPPS